MKFVWPPIINAIETRQSQIANALASAEAAKKRASRYEKILLNKNFQLQKYKLKKILDAANKTSQWSIRRSEGGSRRTKSKNYAQGYAEVEAERKRVQEELRVKVASLAMAGAEKIVGRSIDEAANNDIIDKLVAEL